MADVAKIVFLPELGRGILEAFEGDPDEHAQRGRMAGWRFHGMPWRQR